MSEWSGKCPRGLHGLDYEAQVCDLCAALESMAYRRVCISLYKEDVERLNAMSKAAKAKGMSMMNKSRLIRIALSRLDIDTLTLEDRGR